MIIHILKFWNLIISYLAITLEDDHSSTFITSGQQLAIVVELYT